MGGDGARQAFQVISALKQGDDAAAASPPRDFHQAPGYPGVVRLDEIDGAQRVAAVGVEACRDEDQIG